MGLGVGIDCDCCQEQLSYDSDTAEIVRHDLVASPVLCHRCRTVVEWLIRHPAVLMSVAREMT